MQKRFWGLVSLGLNAAAVTVGGWAVYSASLEMALIYLFLVLVCANIVLYSFCAKCPDRGEHCVHVFPGMLAVHLPQRKQRAYLGRDLGATIMALLVILAFPQYWLWQQPVLFGLFWLLVIVSQFMNHRRVCCECRNRNCPLCRDRSELEKLAR